MNEDEDRDAAAHLIFARAAVQQPERRPQILHKVCEGDAALREQLAGALDSEAKMGGASDLPEKLAGYEIIRALGRGAMGEVWLARDPALDREVALKRVHVGAVDREDAKVRFQREMRAVARLSHPNIVSAYHAIEVEGDEILVMEYVPGEDLATMIRANGPVPVKEAIEWTLQAARGLRHAHEAGIVHRDIKPANLLRHENGTLKILDLGLARVEMGESGAFTRTGSVMGTVDFMAPEQANEARDADHRSDIYSLGCTLYFLLTGQPVFDGETIYRKIKAHVENPVPDLISGDGADFPQNVNRVFRKMLAKDPDQRHASMAEVIEDLEGLLAAPEARETFPPAGKKKSSVFSAIAIMLGCLGAMGLVGWWLWPAARPVADESGLPNNPPPTAGHGHFIDSDQRLGNDHSVDSALGDLDGDGDLDAVVANYGDGVERIWLNDGEGRFSEGMTLGIGASTTGVAMGDLDRDGDLDLVLTERNSSDRVFLNDGKAAFVPLENAGFSSTMSRSVSLGDLNGDEILDAVISCGGVGNRTPNTVWFGDGYGRFADSRQALGTDASWESVLVDLDGDGDLDIVFANGDDRGENQEAPNTMWLNDGLGGFQLGGSPFDPSFSRGIALADFDGDGDLDAVVGNDIEYASRAWINDGDLTFSRGATFAEGYQKKPTVGDFNGDGNPDIIFLAWNNGVSDEIILWLNDGAGAFSRAGVFGHGHGQTYAGLSSGDLDGDGDWDLFVPREKANEVWLNEAPDPVPTLSGNGDSFPRVVPRETSSHGGFASN